VTTKATSAGETVAVKVGGIVTWAVLIALEGNGMTRTVAATLRLLVLNDSCQVKLTRNPTESPPTCLSPCSSGPRVSSADLYNSWLEPGSLKTGESEV
jgi:hypothetical protein